MIQQPADNQSRTSLIPGIHADPNRLVWLLVAERSTYALGVTGAGFVVNLHWGPRLATSADLADPRLPTARSSQDPALSSAAEEYPGAGGLRYGETALRAVFADGVRDLDLRYVSHKLETTDAGDELLILYLLDAVYPLRVTLRYQLDVTNDLIIRSVSLLNEGKETLRLERAFSAAWHLPRQYAPRVLTTLAGQWAEETRLQRRAIAAGTVLIESRRGITSVNAAPWFAIETEQAVLSAQSVGEIYFGTLAWSGNWMIRVTGDVNGATAVVGGISDYDFVWPLEAGETFVAPDFIAGFAPDGLNGVRRRLQRYTRESVLPRAHAAEPRPVLYNSWEATFFDVHEPGQTALAEHAARMGVELFVVDDGWFRGRNADNAGLGDWSPDPHKFPQGLGPLIARVNALGMQFGLWVEPEMVNPDSDLYRAHPDWVYSFPTRPRSEARNQMVLNLGREDVWAYLFEVLNALVAGHAITFLKWDMNRPISEPGWTDYLLSGGEAREIWVRHTRGVYRLMEALRKQHPHLTIESCASGGGRTDLGILRYTDQVWSSDNTHPDARLLIQEGLSLMLPARVMGAWVTDAGRGEVPLAFRFHVAMMGALGVGGNLQEWSTEELDEAAQWIAVYKAARSLVQEGQQAWLLSPHATAGDLAAVQYNAADQHEALIFAFRRSFAFRKPLPPLCLRDLQADRRYSIEVAEGGSFVPAGEQTLSGAALMARGLKLPLPQRSYASCLVRVRSVTE